MTDKYIYTYEEMCEYLDMLETTHEYYKDFPIDRTPFKEQGFECIHNFCHLECGWVVSFEDCCPYCVHTIVKAFGTRAEKEYFNKVKTLNDEYIIPLSRKDVALDHKKRYKRKGKIRIRRSYDLNSRVSRKGHEKRLKQLHSYGVNICRRTKDKSYQGLFGFTVLGGEEVFSSFYIYLPNVKNFNKNFVCTNEDSLIADINKVTNKYGFTVDETLNDLIIIPVH